MKNVSLFNRLVIGLLASGILFSAVAQVGSDTPKFIDVTIDFAKLDGKFVRVGANTSVSRILSVQKGQSEAQGSHLLGRPLAVSCMNGAPTWEYQFSLPLSDGQESLVCQFIVKFGSAAGVVEQTHWRRPQCQALAGTAINLSADVLVGIDQDRLCASGIAELDSMVAGLRQRGGSLLIDVVGHTDRSGDASYNQNLSERRAQSAANHLTARGVPAQAVRARGQGEAEPLVVCEGNRANAALKQCLAPNRRTSIQIRTASY